MLLDPGSPLPLYQQFILVLERKIASGEWPPGSAIPTEMALIKEYGISRTTVREAFNAMVQEGKIVRQRGRGTFVARPRIAEPLAHLTGFVEELALRGLSPTVTVLDCRIVSPPARVVTALALRPGAKVLHVQRHVTVDGSPLFVDDSYFSEDLAGILDKRSIASRPIYELLTAAGRVPTEGDQWLEAVRLPRDVAQQLQSEPDAPGLAITRLTRDHLGVPIEFTSVIYHGDRYQYAIRLQRGQTPPHPQ
jgi:GntR family transcriptional regulator